MIVALCEHGDGRDDLMQTQVDAREVSDDFPSSAIEN